MKIIRYAISLMISFGLLWWAFSRVEFNELGQALAGTNYYLLLLCIPILLFTYAGRSLLLGYILRPVAMIPFASLLAATVIGAAANMILPARLGEVIRAIELKRREAVPAVSGLTAIGLERVFDAVTVIGLFILGAVSMGLADAPGSQATATRGVVGLLVLGSGVILALAAAVAIKPDAARRAINTLSSILPEELGRKIQLAAESVIDVMLFFRNPKEVIIVSIWAIVIWTANAVPLCLTVAAVGQTAPLSAAFFVQGLVCLSSALPQAPGYVGTTHAAIQWGYSQFIGMSPQHALTVAIIYHGLFYFFSVLWGVTYLIRGQFSLFHLKMTFREMD